jgi:hypothetical protein
VNLTVCPEVRPPVACPVYSSITGDIGQLLRLWERQLNSEGYISLFSGAHPNTSGFTAQPGNLCVNIGSASTSTRLFIAGGGTNSLSTNLWSAVRVV